MNKIDNFFILILKMKNLGLEKLSNSPTWMS